MYRTFITYDNNRLFFKKSDRGFASFYNLSLLKCNQLVLLDKEQPETTMRYFFPGAVCDDIKPIKTLQILN